MFKNKKARYALPFISDFFILTGKPINFNFIKKAQRALPFTLGFFIGLRKTEDQTFTFSKFL